MGIVFVLLGLIAFIIAFHVGYLKGKRDGAETLVRALGVPDGYRITGVSYEKIN